MSPNDKWYEFSSVVLLTGAGFTKSFGGYLGSEMWAAILNQPEIRDDSKLRECMLNETTLNFEAVYHTVLESSEFTQVQQQLLTSAIRRVYREMDQILSEQRGHEAANCQDFLGHFGGSADRRTRGFFFTLNQDLFIERFYIENGDERKTLRIPGLTKLPNWFRGSVGPIMGERENDVIELPNEDSLEKYKEKFWTKGTGQFMYLKLHGSYAWQSADGSGVMVIGHGKRGAIDKEPLLRWYMSLFEEVLSAGKRRLVVVGYGFGDDHINKIIAQAIKKRDLKLIVVGPMQPRDFRDQLLSLHGTNIQRKPYGEEIWRGLAGYYPYQVTDFYEAGSSTLPPRGRDFIQSLGLI